MPMDVQEFASDEGMWVGAWENVAIQFWRGQPTVPRLESCDQCHQRVLRRHPNRLVTFAVIGAETPPRIDKDARERIDRMAKDQRAATLAAVQVVEGSGFWASTTRAVLTGLNMLSVTRNRVFSSVPDACAWVVREGHVAGSDRDLVALVEQARRAFDSVRFAAR